MNSVVKLAAQRRRSSAMLGHEGQGCRIVNRLPEILTHNYDPEYGPFRNLCALSREQMADVFAGIGLAGLRRVKPGYLERRLATERWLHAERTRRLGSPRLAHPIYFFLGDFADGRDPGRPASLQIPLASLPTEAITFTVADSMTSHALATLPAHAPDRQPHHGQLFTLEEIRDYVVRHGLPVRDATGYDRFIELQLWDDRPLTPFLPA
jgi:hypothetical protein